MQTFGLEWLIGIGLSALVVGLLLGLAMGRTVFRGKKSIDTEAELKAAQEAMKDYRAEVYDQFAETARKFDTLNNSYNDLHRHLASSANVLLGDGVSTPLLRGPSEPDGAEDSGLSSSEAADAADAGDDHIEGEAEAVAKEPAEAEAEATATATAKPEATPETTPETTPGAAPTDKATAASDPATDAEPAPKP